MHMTPENENIKQDGTRAVALDELSKEELISEVKKLKEQLKKNKAFGLVFERQVEDSIIQRKTKVPVLVENKEKFIDHDSEDNILIIGDNFDSLTVLLQTHRGKVDVIYIDPPYNTGNNDFIYDDKYVNSEDSFRHSKWLSFMENRLLLAKELLSDAGVIFISIDDNEQAELKMLMDQIFGANNFISNFIWRKKFSLSFTSNNVINVHEYLLCYSKGSAMKNLIDPYWNTRETKTVAPIFKSQNGYSEKIFRKGTRLSNAISEEEYIIKACEKRLKSQTLIFKNDMVFINGILKEDSIVGGRFAVGQDFLDKNADEIRLSESGMAYFEPASQEKAKTISPISILGDYTSDDKDFLYETYNFRKSLSTRQGTKELSEIFEGSAFSNPKPLNLIKELLKYFNHKNATILDFFAGSGTTGHAVLELNKEDGGNRTFVLCTNDEAGIGETVTYERLKRVITGENWADGKEHEPYNASLRYYNIDFVKRDENIEQNLLNSLIDLIKIKEDSYSEVYSDGNNHYKILTNKASDKYVGILKNRRKIESFAEYFINIEPATLVIYNNGGNYMDEDCIQNLVNKGWEIEFIDYPNSFIKDYKYIDEKLNIKDIKESNE